MVSREASKHCHIIGHNYHPLFNALYFSFLNLLVNERHGKILFQVFLVFIVFRFLFVNMYILERSFSSNLFYVLCDRNNI